jgi:predicted GNAT family N-acyltransferase
MTILHNVPFDPHGPAMAIRTTVFVEEQLVPPELEQDEFDWTASHVLAVIDEAPAGTARVRLIDPQTAKIERVAVLAAHRSRGVGVALMRAVEAIARNLGATTAKLGAQTHAVGFYTALGYETYGEPFDDAGIPHRHMQRPL